MYLTKTDFVHYLQCPRSLWLLKHKPEIYPHKEFSDFLKKITREGYEIERYAQTLFPDGVSLPAIGNAAITKTREAVKQKVKTVFQATVQTEDGLFARADILTRNDDGTYNLYEVKSSSSIKKDKKHNHLKDACFQKIAFERSNIAIDKVFIIHTNGDYVREMEINPHKLLKKVCSTEEIKKIYDETEIEINNALSLLREKHREKSVCPCSKKTKSNHCDAFEYFNGALPERSIWEIGNLREKKLCTMLDRNIQKMEEIPEDIELNDRQQRQVQSVIQGRPIIDEERIQEMLAEMQFPLYFFDYEAASSAVPKIVGTRPWQQIPFQFSLHILGTGDTLTHKEHLNETLSGPEGVVEALCEMIGEVGSVVSWHASYEKTMNKEMAKKYPQYAKKLHNINDRTVDLEDIFKEAYTDAAFCGSTSIKKVLPILCPNLSYKDLAVQDGTQAMEQWFAMTEKRDKAARDTIRANLLEYCKLDTLAMVEIYKKIRTLSSA
ncbi:MAG: DUF2779 domain-containing protein [Candidatus Kaiserbacteria bacterium]|nr:DUF2779 domain-containing protein [Candidatus Kaiserbacteria bacterium]